MTDTTADKTVSENTEHPFNVGQTVKSTIVELYDGQVIAPGHPGKIEMTMPGRVQVKWDGIPDARWVGTGDVSRTLDYAPPANAEGIQLLVSALNQEIEKRKAAEAMTDEGLQADIERLNKDLADSEDDVRQMRAEGGQLQERIDELEAENTRLAEDNAALKDVADDLNAHDFHQDAWTGQAEENARLQDEITTLKAALERMEAVNRMNVNDLMQERKAHRATGEKLTVAEAALQAHATGSKARQVDVKYLSVDPRSDADRRQLEELLNDDWRDHHAAFSEGKWHYDLRKHPMKSIPTPSLTVKADVDAYSDTLSPEIEEELDRVTTALLPATTLTQHAPPSSFTPGSIVERTRRNVEQFEQEAWQVYFETQAHNQMILSTLTLPTLHVRDYDDDGEVYGDDTTE